MVGENMKLKYMFDLKGSLINRETKINMKKHKPGMTLKDINLLTIRKSENLLKFSSKDMANIMDMIERDAKLLRKANIMDYSLLLAIENNSMYNGSKGSRNTSASSQVAEVSSLKTPKLGLRFSDDSEDKKRNRGQTAKMEHPGMRANAFFQPTRHRFLSYSGEYIYHIAIIDYLQEYNWDKRSEHYAKSIFRGRGAEISAVPPLRYMKRFIEFMGNEVIIDDKNRSSKSYTTS